MNSPSIENSNDANTSFTPCKPSGHDTAVNGPNRDSSGPLVDVMAAAFYGSAYGATGIEAILRGLAKVAVGRGVTVSGY